MHGVRYPAGSPNGYLKVIPNRTKSMSNGLVVSDLHIFSAVSTWQQHSARFETEIAASTTVVLNGDIFDFKRSTFDSTADTVKAAIAWLERRLDDHPDTKFHYVIGNHDAVTPFIQALESLAGRYPALSVYYSHVVIGSCLFLHGDVCHSRMTLEDLKSSRRRYATIEPSGVSKFLAKLIVALRINLIAYLTHPKERMCRHILYFLEHHAPSDLAGISHIYFGHTHVAFEDYSYKGKVLTNTGGAISNLRCTTARFPVPG